MSLLDGHRWIASLMGIALLVSGNCICVRAIWIPANLPVQATSHACCNKGQNKAPEHRQPAKDRSSQCPHCNGVVGGAVVAKQSEIASPHFSPSICAIDWRVSALPSPLLSFAI